jgi:hypothetical protein
MSVPALIRDWSALSEWADPASAVAIRECDCFASARRSLLPLEPACSANTSNAQTIYLIESGIVKLSRVTSAGETVAAVPVSEWCCGRIWSPAPTSSFRLGHSATDCQIVTMPGTPLLDICRSNAGRPNASRVVESRYPCSWKMTEAKPMRKKLAGL